MRATINEIRNPYWRRLNVIVAGFILLLAMVVLIPIDCLFRGIWHGLAVDLPFRLRREFAKTAATLLLAWRGQRATGLTPREILTGRREQGAD